MFYDTITLASAVLMFINHFLFGFLKIKLHFLKITQRKATYTRIINSSVLTNANAVFIEIVCLVSFSQSPIGEVKKKKNLWD